MNRLILFLIRKKLGLKKYQKFYFKNQANKNNRYAFGECYLRKYPQGFNLISFSSNLSLNFLLSDEAKELLIKV